MTGQDELYKEASAVYGPAIQRLAKGYEADADRRRDLLQDIHIELWRSLRLFNGRCSSKTWVYRVAHNVGASYITKRAADRLVSLDALKLEGEPINGEAHANQRYSASRLLEGIYLLRPLDRQIILLYLEGETAGAIADVTGLSASNVATKIHRLKQLLSRTSGQGTLHGER